jgi:hypothetical protein
VRHNANVYNLAGPLLPRHPAWDPPVTWPGALAVFMAGLALVLWPCVALNNNQGKPENST